MKLSSLSKLLLLLCVCCIAILPAKAQQSTGQVSGSVKNERGEPLQSVSVKVAGTEKGTVTDTKGNFTLTVPDNTFLVFSYIGYDTLQVKAQANLSITLIPSTGALNDVVVIGYGTQRRKELTGSVATVTAKDFQQGVITTPEQLIAGKVAGVSVTSNGGAPGAGSVIRIRGGASLNAS